MSGISPGFDLLYYLDRSILAEIQANLKELGSLYAINARDFCFVVLKWLCLRWNHWHIDDAVIYLVCRVFECVDVDSRGVISWDDFNAYCLRVGRNQFKPTFRHSVLDYTQRFAYSVHIPARRLLYVPSTQMLYAFDGDQPTVSIIGRDGRMIGRFNPTTAIVRLLRLQETGRQTYYFKKQHAAAATAAKKRALALTSQKGLITCMAYIERKRQLVFCTSNGFLSFWDASVGCLIGFVRTGSAQIGLCLSPTSDALLTWPGEVDDTAYRVWDINTRKLRCQAVKHDARALCVIEIAQHKCIASSTLGRDIILWPVNQLKKVQFTSSKNTYLKGHRHAISKLVYAPDHDLLLGSGFDYDVYVWDMSSKLLTMCLSGHRSSVVSIMLVYTPFEHAVSVDDGGTLKVWNIDLADNKHADVVQTLVLARDSPSQPVLDAEAAMTGGSTIAVLGDSLYMVDISNNVGNNESKPLSTGIGICEPSDSIFVVTSRVLASGTLSGGARMRRYLYIDDDRVENATGVFLSLNRETMNLLGKGEDMPLSIQERDANNDASSLSSSLHNATQKIKLYEKNGGCSEKLDEMRNEILNSLVDPKDDISAVTPDPTGKKLFIGTTGGKVFIYDTSSFGLLTQVKGEIPTSRSHGAVISLIFIPQDELLLVGYAAGSVRLLMGCHRTSEEAEAAIAKSATATAEAQKLMAAQDRENNDRNMNRPGSPSSPEGQHANRMTAAASESVELSVINCPLPGGGKPHPHPVLVRRNDAVHEQMILAVAISREYGLIAVSGDDGSVRILDYYSFQAVTVVSAPMVHDRSTECNHLAFCPRVPVLFGSDVEGRITAWTVRPMEVAWILTWPVDYTFTVQRGTANVHKRETFEDTDDMDEENILPSAPNKVSDISGSGIPITCMRSCMYMLPPSEDDEGHAAETAPTSRNRLSSSAGMSIGSDPFADLASEFTFKWVIICGDQIGKMYEFDVTKMLHHIRCFDKDVKPNVSTNPLAAYQQRTLANFRDELEEKRLGHIETLLARPIGAKSGSASLKMTEMLGYRGANITHVKRQAVWFAYQAAGVSTLTVLQKETNMFPASTKSSKGRRMVLEPYAILTASDIGVVRMWSWQGTVLGQLTEDELMTPEEYSKSVLSKDLGTICQEGTNLLNSLSVDYVNMSVGENLGMAGMGNSMLAAGTHTETKGNRRASISSKDSLQRQGWIYPEWQITRPTQDNGLPLVTPFSQLPAEFTPRLELLRDWVSPHVKAKIKELADANRLINNHGDIVVADANSTFLEQLYSHMDGGRKSFASVIAAPMEAHLSMKPEEREIITAHEERQNDWDSLLSKPALEIEASMSTTGSLGKLEQPGVVSKDIANAVKDRRSRLMVEQLKRQSSQEVWDRKVRFPNLATEQTLRKHNSTLGQDDGARGTSKEKRAASPENQEHRIRPQAEANFDKNSDSLQQTLVQIVKRTSSPTLFTPRDTDENQQRSAVGGSWQTPPLLTKTQIAEHVQPSARSNTDSLTGQRRESFSLNKNEELRKNSLILVSRRFSSNFDDDKNSEPDGGAKKMSLEDIYMTNIKAKNSMSNMFSDRNGSFVSARDDQELLDMMGELRVPCSIRSVHSETKKGEEGFALSRHPSQVSKGEGLGLERTSTYSAEDPPLRFEPDLLDSVEVAMCPTPGAPPPQPDIKQKLLISRGSDPSIVPSKYAVKRAAEFAKRNMKLRASEVEYSDTESEESQDLSIESNRGGTQRVPFGGISCPPQSGPEQTDPEEPGPTLDRSVPELDRPSTTPAPRQKASKKSNVSRIDEIIANIESVNSAGVRTVVANKRLKQAVSDARSTTSDHSENEILFFNNSRPVTAPHKKKRVSDGRIGNKIKSDSIMKSPLNMSTLAATVERFDRLTAGEESTGHRQHAERDARERKIEAARAMRRRDKQALNNLDTEASSAGDLTARSESVKGFGKGGANAASATGPFATTGALSSERGRTRYGPYKAKDVHVFIDFIEELDATVSRLGHDKNDFSDAKSYLIGDVLSQQEILHRPKFNREITRIASKNNSVVTLVDLLSVLFPYASQAEWHRMKTLVIGKRLVKDCLNALIPPPEPALLSPPRSPTRLSMQSTAGSSRYVFSPAATTKSPVKVVKTAPSTPVKTASENKSSPQPQPKQPGTATPLPNTAPGTPVVRQNSTMRPPSTAGGRATGVGKIPIRETMSAWQLPYEAADDIKRALDLLYEVETGTLTGNDIVDIFNMHDTLKDLDCIKTLARYMVRHGFNLQEEINGQRFIEMLECVLHVEILKNTKGRNHRAGDQTGNVSYTRVRLLSTMIHNSDLKKVSGTSAHHAQTKLKLRVNTNLNSMY